MKTVYQVFAEGKDGHFLLVAEGGGPRWFEDVEEARRVGSVVAAAGNVSKVWLAECRMLEELPIDSQSIPQRKKPEVAKKADVHIFHELRAEKPLLGEHSCSGDECTDNVTGAIHSRGDLDAIVEALHGLGFQVSASRMTRTPVVEDPLLLGKDD